MPSATLVDRKAIETQLKQIEQDAAAAAGTTATLMTLRGQMGEQEGRFVVQLHRSARGLKAAARALLNEMHYQQL